MGEAMGGRDSAASVGWAGVAVLSVACCERPQLLSVARSEGHGTPPASSHMNDRPLGKSLPLVFQLYWPCLPAFLLAGGAFLPSFPSLA